MKKFARLGILAGLVALGAMAGCSKSEKGEAPQAKAPQAKEVGANDTDVAKPAEAKAVADVAGLAKETLLVLKFHHDS